ncbi:hypothetical protein VLK31_32455 [Variovorax sp. H27-G14]
MQRVEACHVQHQFNVQPKSCLRLSEPPVQAAPSFLQKDPPKFETVERSRNSVGAIAVTCRKAVAKAAVLAKPAAIETLAIASPLASRSMARTIRAHWRHALNVRPVSAGNTRLALRIEVAEREASSSKLSRF